MSSIAVSCGVGHRPLGSCIAVAVVYAGNCSSNSVASLGSHRFGPKKLKKKKKKKKREREHELLSRKTWIQILVLLNQLRKCSSVAKFVQRTVHSPENANSAIERYKALACTQPSSQTEADVSSYYLGKGRRMIDFLKSSCLIMVGFCINRHLMVVLLRATHCESQDVFST